MMIKAKPANICRVATPTAVSFRRFIILRIKTCLTELCHIYRSLVVKRR